MRTKISTGIVESRLRLDWANLLEEEIKRLQSGGLNYVEAKAILRQRLGFTKDTLNSHLEGANTVDVVNFIYACNILGVTYIIDSSGCSQFIETDSIFSGRKTESALPPSIAQVGY